MSPGRGLAMRRSRRDGCRRASACRFWTCICCGFGAIILLLVLTKIGEPAPRWSASRVDLDGLIARLQEELFTKSAGETSSARIGT